MGEQRTIIPVWLFVGIILLVYGILILGTGIHEFSNPPDVVLSRAHAPLWWGALMTVVGAIYSYLHWPRKKQQRGPSDAAGERPTDG
jgi:hypothetical protein